MNVLATKKVFNAHEYGVQKLVNEFVIMQKSVRKLLTKFNMFYSHPKHLRGSVTCSMLFYWQTHKSINRICKL